MKKKFVNVAAVMAAASLLAACSGGGADAGGGKEDIELWFWGASPAQRQIFEDSLVKPYNESQDKYRLVATFNEKVDSNIQTALAANKGPDIVYGSGPAFVAPYARSGKLADMTPYAEQYGWEDKILKPIYDSGVVDGKLYAVANSINTIGMFYNKAVLDQLGVGVPSTMAELEDAMAKAEAAGLYPSVTGNKGWQPVNENYSSMFLTHFAGPDAMYKVLTGAAKWTDPVYEQAVQKSAEWYQSGKLGGGQYLNLTFSESMSLLAQEKSPFFFGPTLAFQFAGEYFNDEAGNVDDLGFTAFPNFDEALPAPLYTISTTASFSINENSKNKDEAAKIIDQMIQEDFGISMTEQWPGYWAVPLKDLDLTKGNMTGLSATYAEAVSEIIPAINDGRFGYFSGTFFPPKTKKHLIDIESVWLGQTDVKPFMAETEKLFEEELADGDVPEIPKP